MKRLIYIAMTVITAITAAGCSKFEEVFTEGHTKKISMVASFVDQTRTNYMGSGKVDWVSGDIIRYYSKRNGTVDEYEVVRSGRSTNVVADVASGTSYIVAAYGGESITDNAVNSFTLNGAVKSEQTGKFEDAHVSVAKAFEIEDGASLSFHNMTSLIKFSIVRSDVAYITFTAKGGEKIHGNGVLKITFVDDQPSVAFGEGGGSTIRVNTEKAGTYFLSTLPVDLLNGFEISNFDASGELIFNIDYHKAFSLGTNEIIDLGALDDRMPEYVDLGLSVMWSTCNLGAFKPEDSGCHYYWAGLQDTTSTSIYTDWSNCPYHTGTDRYSGWTKYVPSNKSSYWSGSGSPDNKTVLDPEDDVAHVKLGGKWRMPTREEWNELIDNCTWTWTTQNGINGYKVTSNKAGYTNNSIFLPATSRSQGIYWSSSLYTDPDGAYYLNFSSRSIWQSAAGRISELSVRPVYGNAVKVTGVNISKTSISLPQGTMSILSAAVTPTNAVEKGVLWTSSNHAVATVDCNGKVTAFMAGNATITAKSVDGGYIATCDVTVSPMEYVDLGLNIKWATCNLGASKPEEFGGYYQWAGLEGVTDPSINLDCSKCPYHTGSDFSTGWTKYVPLNKSSYWSGLGSPDNKTVLDPEDDVAHVTLGGRWRMPTNAEWQELQNNCTSEWTTLNGVKGRKFTSKKNGNSIFLPAAGCRYDDSLYDVGSNGDYWSSSLLTVSPEIAYSLSFSSDDVGTYYYYRYCGQSVRPVSE